MLDPRIYRAGWIPVLFVLVLVAFSLHEAPRPAGTTLSAQAFDGGAALSLARSFARDRNPAGVARRLRGAGFSVHFSGSGPDRAVLATRTGFASRRIVLVADRASPSATGTLLELAQVLGGRTLGRTLVLASVAGPDPGSAVDGLTGALGGPVDAALVIGDLGVGPERHPWVVPWGSRRAVAPLGLRRTVEAALRAETGRSPGAPGLGSELGRFALPLTLGAQGPLLGAGVPAVLVSSAGERGAGGASPTAAAPLAAFGRGILRAATALDSSGPVAPPGRALVLAGKVFPEWAVRALTGAFLLPILLALIDALARVRRRRGDAGRWLAWAFAGALPLLLAVLLTRALGVAGALRRAPAALAVPLGTQGAVALAGFAALLVLGGLARRPLARSVLHLAEPGAAPGAALGALSVTFAGVIVLWVGNPYTASLGGFALHLWLLAVAPETRPRRAGAVTLALLGLLPFALLALGYARVFGLGPLGFAWTLVLALAGGAVPLTVALAWALVLGGFASVIVIAARAASAPAPAGGDTAARSVRGPASYAGPGSLGGTESALRR